MQPPKLHRHAASGQFYVKWGGRFRYLGRDQQQAEARYWDSIAEWRRWRENKKQAKREGRRQIISVADLVSQFLDDRQRTLGSDGRTYYEKHTRRFNHLYGRYDAELVRPSHLNALKADMLSDRYAPKTINHDLTAIRVMFHWGSGLDMIPPIDLRGVKNLPLGPVEEETVSPERIRFIVWSAPVNLRPWLAINYLAMLRPSEVVRCVKGEGEWVKPGIFRLSRGKMDDRASIKRHCMFSDEALSWLKVAEVHWRNQDNYQVAVRRTSPITAKQFQKSGAAHLVQIHDVDRDDAELLLGHAKGRLSVTYFLPAFVRLRGVAAHLSLGSDPHAVAAQRS